MQLQCFGASGGTRTHTVAHLFLRQARLPTSATLAIKSWAGSLGLRVARLFIRMPENSIRSARLRGRPRRHELVLRGRIELPTFPLPRGCTATVLSQRAPARPRTEFSALRRPRITMECFRGEGTSRHLNVHWCRREGSSLRASAYRAAALHLSYAGLNYQTSVHGRRAVKPLSPVRCPLVVHALTWASTGYRKVHCGIRRRRAGDVVIK